MNDNVLQSLDTALRDLHDQNAQRAGQILALRLVLAEVVGLLVMLDSDPGRSIRRLFEPLMRNAAQCDQALNYTDPMAQQLAQRNTEALHAELAGMMRQLLDRLANTPRG